MTNSANTPTVDLVDMCIESLTASEEVTRNLYPYTDAQIREAVDRLEPTLVRPGLIKCSAPWLAAIMSAPIADETRVSINRQADALLLLATKSAKQLLGTAWDTMAHLRSSVTASELLRHFAGKDQDAASSTTAKVMIEAACRLLAEDGTL